MAGLRQVLGELNGGRWTCGVSYDQLKIGRCLIGGFVDCGFDGFNPVDSYISYGFDGFKLIVLKKL